jgi:alpha-glucosidase (family GH31 glycosyl hydrolase)
MGLKPITLRLDEEEYENLKENLGRFGDPDINTAYVIRAYIRDLNRAFPYIISAGWDLKNYFGLLGIWLRQFVRMIDADMFTKDMIKWWPNWFTSLSPDEHNAKGEPLVYGKTRHRPAYPKGGDKKA